MEVDWGHALQIGGVGFGIVFLVLIILAIAIWLVGLLLSKIGIANDETASKKKGA